MLIALLLSSVMLMLWMCVSFVDYHQKQGSLSCSAEGVSPSSKIQHECCTVQILCSPFISSRVIYILKRKYYKKKKKGSAVIS